jgi:ABC-type nitrate/sulfonate/bicarbonate transport system permease component
MIVLYRLAFLALLLALWIVAADQMGRNVVPTPWETFQAAQRLIESGRLLTALQDSLTVYLTGFLLAIVCAAPPAAAKRQYFDLLVAFWRPRPAPYAYSAGPRGPAPTWASFFSRSG